MPELETAYLLTGEELLLLLSLVDQRPVVAFALPDPTHIPTGRWAQVAVDLHQDGLIDYVGNGVLPAGPIAEVLAAMKDASTVCLALSRDADRKTQALYQGGQQIVLLQGNYWPGFRLRTWVTAPAHWLDNCLGLPKRVPDRGVALPESQSALPRLSLTTTSSSWGRWEQARVILDVYRRDQMEQRLVWWQNATGYTVLWQNETGTRLLPDCQMTRNALKKHLWKGE